MTAKEYLQQAYRIDLRIDNKVEQVFRLRALLTKATRSMSAVPSSSPENGRKMEEIIAKIADLEAEINADIDALVRLKEEITASIKAIGNPEQETLLEMRYLTNCTWEEIAVAIHYSIRNVYRLHDAALEKISVPDEACH